MQDCNVSWSTNKFIETVHQKLDHFGHPIRKNDFTKELPDTEARCVLIRMSVFDSQLCKGPEVSEIVHLPAHLPHDAHDDVRLTMEPWIGGNLTQSPKYFIPDNSNINFNWPCGHFHNSGCRSRCLCLFLEDAEKECRELLAGGLSQRTEWVRNKRT